MLTIPEPHLLCPFAQGHLCWVHEVKGVILHEHLEGEGEEKEERIQVLDFPPP